MPGNFSFLSQLNVEIEIGHSDIVFMTFKFSGMGEYLFNLFRKDAIDEMEESSQLCTLPVGNFLWPSYCTPLKCIEINGRNIDFPIL